MSAALPLSVLWDTAMTRENFPLEKFAFLWGRWTIGERTKRSEKADIVSNRLARDLLIRGHCSRVPSKGGGGPWWIWIRLCSMGNFQAQLWKWVWYVCLLRPQGTAAGIEWVELGNTWKIGIPEVRRVGGARPSLWAGTLGLSLRMMSATLRSY